MQVRPRMQNDLARLSEGHHFSIIFWNLLRCQWEQAEGYFGKCEEPKGDLWWHKTITPKIKTVESGDFRGLALLPGLMLSIRHSSPCLNGNANPARSLKLRTHLCNLTCSQSDKALWSFIPSAAVLGVAQLATNSTNTWFFFRKKFLAIFSPIFFVFYIYFYIWL